MAKNRTSENTPDCFLSSVSEALRMGSGSVFRIFEVMFLGYIGIAMISFRIFAGFCKGEIVVLVGLIVIVVGWVGTLILTD